MSVLARLLGFVRARGAKDRVQPAAGSQKPRARRLRLLLCVLAGCLALDLGILVRHVRPRLAAQAPASGFVVEELSGWGPPSLAVLLSSRWSSLKVARLAVRHKGAPDVRIVGRDVTVTFDPLKLGFAGGIREVAAEHLLLDASGPAFFALDELASLTGMISEVVSFRVSARSSQMALRLERSQAPILECARGAFDTALDAAVFDPSAYGLLESAPRHPARCKLFGKPVPAKAYENGAIDIDFSELLRPRGPGGAHLRTVGRLWIPGGTMLEVTIGNPSVQRSWSPEERRAHAGDGDLLLDILLGRKPVLSGPWPGWLQLKASAPGRACLFSNRRCWGGLRFELRDVPEGLPQELDARTGKATLGSVYEGAATEHMPGGNELRVSSGRGGMDWADLPFEVQGRIALGVSRQSVSVRLRGGVGCGTVWKAVARRHAGSVVAKAAERLYRDARGRGVLPRSSALWGALGLCIALDLDFRERSASTVYAVGRGCGLEGYPLDLWKLPDMPEDCLVPRE